MFVEDLVLLENMLEVEYEGDGLVLLFDEIMIGWVVLEMVNVDGCIFGFVVFLKIIKDMEIFEFFLVFYYGVCIYVLLLLLN